MRRVPASLVAAFLLAAAGSCSSSTGPVAGVLTVSLATPNAGADGAILLTITGPSPLTSASAAGGVRLFSEALADMNHFALTGPLPNGPLLTIGVADVNRVAQYVARIQDVAGNDDQLRPSLAGYSLSISK